MKAVPRRVYAFAVIVLAAVMFAALNIALDASVTTAQLDLTQNGAFTLAKGTRNIIRKIEEPVTLKFFYSKSVAVQYAQVQAYANRVRDLLLQYATLSHGKIVLQEIDPEPFTPAEDAASAAGLTGVPTESGDMVYFGLAGTNSIGAKETLPFFSQEREKYLEYDLTSLLYRLSTPKKQVLGVISSLPLETGSGGMAAALQGHAQPLIVYAQLRADFTTKMLEGDFDRIPPDVDVLLIAQPPALSDRQLFAIDQFVLRGGRALVFVDPYSEIVGGSQGGQSSSPVASDLPRLLRTWGVRYTPDKVIGDRTLAQRVQSQDPRNPYASYPIWLHLTPDNFNSSDPLTANLQSLNVASAGALFPVSGSATTFTPLMHSSNQASLLDAPLVRIAPHPEELMAQVHPTGQDYVIAARLSGPAKSAFPAGPPTAASSSATDAQQPSKPLKNSIGPINVVVMADSDIFDDRFWVRMDNTLGRQLATPFADNGAFILNSVESLMGSDDLISLRTRATNDRPFTVVQKLQAQAQTQFQAEADALKQKMTDTQSRLSALQQGGGGAGSHTAQTATLTAEQQAEIERFKRELLETRAQLRDVQHNLRKDIDRLGSILAFVNIALVPLLVALFAIVLAALRRRRRARALAF